MAKVCAWRAQTLQLLSPFLDAGLPANEPGANKGLGKGLNRAYRRLATDLEGDFGPLLKKVTNDEALKRHDELFDICKEVGALSYKLWSQKTRMECVFDFDSETLFDIRSQLMHPHASMLCDHDSTEFNGRCSELCVEPAILAYGNEQGKNYDYYKIWMAATVWIGENSSPKSNATAAITIKPGEVADTSIKQDSDGEGDALSPRPKKRARPSLKVSGVPEADADASATGQFPKPTVQRSAELEMSRIPMPPSSKRNGALNDDATAKTSGRDATQSVDAFQKLTEATRNKQASDALQKKNNLKNGTFTFAVTSASRGATPKSQQTKRNQMADQANIEEMSSFPKILANADGAGKVYEEHSKPARPSAAQPHTEHKAASRRGDQSVAEQSQGVNGV